MLKQIKNMFGNKDIMDNVPISANFELCVKLQQVFVTTFEYTNMMKHKLMFKGIHDEFLYDYICAMKYQIEILNREYIFWNNFISIDHSKRHELMEQHLNNMKKDELVFLATLIFVKKEYPKFTKLSRSKLHAEIVVLDLQITEKIQLIFNLRKCNNFPNIDPKYIQQIATM